MAGNRTTISELLILLGVDPRDFEEGMRDAENEARTFSQRVRRYFQDAANAMKNLGKAMTAALSAPLAIIGGIMVKSVSEISSASNKIKASLGITTAQTKALTQTSIDVWAQGFGEDINDVNSALINTKQTIKSLSGDSLAKYLKGAFTIKDLFEPDIKETNKTIKSMTNNFKGLSESDALDIVTVGFQRGGNFADDLLDTLWEYSPQFANLGFSADKFLALLLAGADAGAFSMDKLGDAVKEFNIRAGDGSDTTTEGFNAIGFSAEKMAESVRAGGDIAKRAFYATVMGLAAIKDPIKRDITAVNLFGVMWEDLRGKAVVAMTQAEKGLGDWKGSTEQATKDLHDNNPFIQMEISMRQLKAAFIPVLMPFANMLQNVVVPAVKAVTTAFGSMPSGAKQAIIGLALLTMIIGPLLWVMGSMVTTIPKAIAAIRGFSIATLAAKAVNALKLAVAGLNFVLIKNPIVFLLMLIGGALIYLANASGILDRYLKPVIDKIKTLASLAGFKINPVEAAEKSTDKATDAMEDLQKQMDAYKDSAKDATKDTEKFLAAFDEIYQVQEDDDQGGNIDEMPDLPPAITEDNNNNIDAGIISTGDSDSGPKTPMFNWPTIPPFPGWPPIPPVFVPKVEPVTIPVVEPAPVEVPAWVYAFVAAFALAFAPIIALVKAFELAWKTCTQLVALAVTTLQEAWSLAWAAMVTVVQPVKELALAFSAAWQTAKETVVGVLIALQTSWETAWAAIFAANPIKNLIDLFQDGFDKIKEVMKDFGDWASDTMGKLADQVKQPLSQALASMESFWENHKTAILVTIGLIIVGIVAWWAGLPALVLEAIAALLPRLAGFLPRVAAAFYGVVDDVVAYFGRIPEKIVTALSSLPGKLLDLGKNAWASFKSAFSGGLSFKLPSIGGFSGGSISVPAFAGGGIATGPTFGLFGEVDDEAILPLNRINPMINTAVAGALRDNSPGGNIDYRQLAEAMVGAMQGAQFKTVLNLGQRELTDIERGLQPIRTRESIRRGGS